MCFVGEDAETDRGAGACPKLHSKGESVVRISWPDALSHLINREA